MCVAKIRKKRSGGGVKKVEDMWYICVKIGNTNASEEMVYEPFGSIVAVDDDESETWVGRPLSTRSEIGGGRWRFDRVNLGRLEGRVIQRSGIYFYVYRSCALVRVGLFLGGRLRLESDGSD